MLHKIALVLVLAALPQRNPSNLNTLVDGINRSFASMKTLSADFEQTVNRKGGESGHLYLARGGKMRWEYKSPEVRYFISDGKTVYDWVPANRQVNREEVPKAGDDRLPAMFLLGRSSLRDEFRQFEEVTGGKAMIPGDRIVRMVPIKKTDLQRVEMEVEPDYTIRRLVLAYVDGGELEFLFSNVRRDVELKAGLFEFKPDKGVVVVEGLNR